MCFTMELYTYLAQDWKMPREIWKELEKPGAAPASEDGQQIAGSMGKPPQGLGPCMTFRA